MEEQGMRNAGIESRGAVSRAALGRARLALSALFAAMILFAAQGSAFAAVSIGMATWSGNQKRLSVSAKEGGRTRTLTATYGGSNYRLSYSRERRQYELTITPVCYAPNVTITSSSGSTASRAVAVTDGTTAGNLCSAPCPDADGDGFLSAACGGNDCNDQNPLVSPRGVEVCGDGIDQDCTSGDLACQSEGHAALRFTDYPAACVGCHPGEAADMHQSTHYQWLGSAPDMVNGVGLPQGKLTNALNSYCINISGNWSGCGACHVGRGKRPDDPTAGTENIDCLVCHSEEYAKARVRLADGSMGVAAPTDSMVRNLHLPTRTTCLLCHAKAGGGDGVKRGDLSLATATNTDPSFDVHMNSAGNDLACQSCHVFRNHRVIGKGSDLRATDDISRGSEIQCAICHAGKDAPGGHATAKIGDHVAHVACQTCHIPTYAKVATEVRRDWRKHADGTPADGASGPGHPWTEKAANLTPAYVFWNRLSDNALLGDEAGRTYDAALGTYPTSRPLGDVRERESKIYPFKYKIAIQPKTVAGDQLVALDTGEYLKRTGNVTTAIQLGLEQMGLPATEPYVWATTDTFQLLNHGVTPASQALACSSCHGSTARMDLSGELGYALKAGRDRVCTQCHSLKSETLTFTEVHGKHVTSKGYDCSWCHTFSRPERGLRLP
jgi:hypothetical protein